MEPITFVTLKTIVDDLYPIGSIYISFNADNPGTKAIFKGTEWELIEDGLFLESTKDVNKVGSTIKAGLPNITGVGHYADNNNDFKGALYNVKNGNYIGDGSASGTLIGLDASRGQTNIDGTVLDPTSEADKEKIVYGKSNTVQPHSILVFMYKRIK